MVVAVRVKELIEKVLQKDTVPGGSFFFFKKRKEKKERETKAGTKVQVR